MFEDINSDFNFDDEVLTTSFGNVEKFQNKNDKKHSIQSVDVQDRKKQKIIPNVEENNKNTIHPPILKTTNNNLFPIINELNVSHNSNSDNSFYYKKIVKRKFPGPAGLLPESSHSSRILEENQQINSEPIGKNNDNDIICSQSTFSIFEDGPWNKMCEDFKPTIPNNIYLPDKYNIQWIKSRAELKLLFDQKAPFLAAIIQSVENDKKIEINLTIKDMTGEIQATMLCGLYKKYSEVLKMGSVIILKQVGVFTTGNNKHFLTITDKSLITIYTRNKIKKNCNNMVNSQLDNSQKLTQEISQYVSDNTPISKTLVNKIIIQPLTSDIILKDIQNFKLQAKSENKPNLPNTHNNSNLLPHNIINKKENIIEPIKKNWNRKTNLNSYHQVQTPTENRIDGNNLDELLKKCNKLIEQNYNSKLDTCGKKEENTTVQISKVETESENILKKPKTPKKFKFTSKKANIFNDSTIDLNLEFNFQENVITSNKIYKISNKVIESPIINTVLNNQSPFINKKEHCMVNSLPINTTDLNNSIVINNSQISIKTDNEEHNEIWKNALEDIDADSLFSDDF